MILSKTVLFCCYVVARFFADFTTRFVSDLHSNDVKQ